ncbi:methyl-accepting chemotaxis protein [Fluviispira vulneris]|uniref:methyl-accepting chemotaxis protein n=1 Tax=Fluviispira vulneris TaxID=2763012 RepID=UPI001646B8BF|nr:methyl-accepting chemotaxis protein [Fluviispira vulneris]
MKNKVWTIRKRLWTLSSLMIILIFCIGVIPFQLNNFYNEKINKFSSEIIPAMNHLTLADMLHDGIRANIFAIVMASESKNHEKIIELAEEEKEFKEKFLNHLNSLNILVLNKKIHDDLKLILIDAKKYTDLSEKIAKLAVAKKAIEAKSNIAPFNEVFKRLEKSIEELTKEVNEFSEKNIKNTNEYGRNSLYFLIAILSIFLSVGILLSKFSIKKLNNSLNSLIIGLNNQSNSIMQRANSSQKSSKELSDMTMKQAAAIQETAASMEEMSSMLTQTSKHSAHNLRISEEGQISAQKGRESISQMLSAMDSIQASNVKLEEISNLIVKIANKTKIINEIVSETRLLSFNASIEAARAGVHGKGFAVVAEEVGKLASMSGSAANEIRELLESSTTEVARVVSDIRERIITGKNISKICEASFDSMTEILFKINEGTKIIVSSTSEQETGMKQTTIAMRQIDEVTQRNSAIGIAQATDSQYLASGIKNISEIILKLRYLIIGNVANDQNDNKKEDNNFPKNNQDNFFSLDSKTDGENKANSELILTDNLPSRNDSRWKA